MVTIGPPLRPALPRAKVVLEGAPGAGKEETLVGLTDLIPASQRGELNSIEIEGDRTLGVDLWVGGGVLEVVTVPGPVRHRATQVLARQWASLAVFVADLRLEQRGANRAALTDLREGMADAPLPLVVQLNRSDAPGRLEPSTLCAELDLEDLSLVETATPSGRGLGKLLSLITEALPKEARKPLLKPCRVRWESLEEGSDEQVRRCAHCDRNVRWITERDELEEATVAGSCVALGSRALEEQVEVLADCELPCAIRRRPWWAFWR